MKYVRFFVYQFLVFCALFFIYLVFDFFIGPPLTRVDWIAIAISLPFLFGVQKVYEKSSSKFSDIHWLIKAAFLIPPFIATLLLAGFAGLLG